MEREPATGKIYRVRREPPEILGAILTVKFEPSIDRPGHCYAQRTRRRNSLESLFSKIVDARLGRCRAAGINRLDFAVLFHKDQRKQIPARTARFGLHHRHHKPSGKRRIDSIAALLQDFNSRQRSKAVACSNHAVLSHDNRARRFAEIHSPPKPSTLWAFPPRIFSLSDLLSSKPSMAFRLFLTSTHPSSGP